MKTDTITDTVFGSAFVRVTDKHAPTLTVSVGVRECERSLHWSHSPLAFVSVYLEDTGRSRVDT